MSKRERIEELVKDYFIAFPDKYNAFITEKLDFKKN